MKKMHVLGTNHRLTFIYINEPYPNKEQYMHRKYYLTLTLTISFAVIANYHSLIKLQLVRPTPNNIEILEASRQLNNMVKDVCICI